MPRGLANPLAPLSSCKIDMNSYHAHTLPKVSRHSSWRLTSSLDTLGLMRPRACATDRRFVMRKRYFGGT